MPTARYIFRYSERPRCAVRKRGYNRLNGVVQYAAKPYKRPPYRQSRHPRYMLRLLTRARLDYIAAAIADRRY